MKPVTFACSETLRQSPEEIAEAILDVTRWREFKGYGPLPGIAWAQFQSRTPEIVGTRIHVLNTDHSTHVEEIVDWRPGVRLQLDMQDFSPPLSRLASKVEEAWTFERLGDATRVTRSFAMRPTSLFARPILWAISFLLKKAISRHLREMRG